MDIAYSIRDMIYVVRGVKVVLDADLAAIYDALLNNPILKLSNI